MQSPNKKISIMAILIVISSLIYYIENFVRLPLPFFRWGFSHIITLFLIYKKFSLRDILFVILLKISLGSLFSGTLFSVIFFLSLTSNIISIISQYLLYYIFFRYVSIYTVSVFGSEINNLSQLFLAYLFIVKNVNIMYVYNITFWFAFFTGLLNAYIANKLNQKIKINGIY